ncbi:hypothetical protein Scep_026136 [Stephania cephalantha]|uniref:Uncharacterized protein n=1 Tax=Stephania cephalantha TaxID=152367 RepID=A0AAP0EPU3_9MAGN
MPNGVGVGACSNSVVVGEQPNKVGIEVMPVVVDLDLDLDLKRALPIWISIWIEGRKSYTLIDHIGGIVGRSFSMLHIHISGIVWRSFTLLWTITLIDHIHIGVEESKVAAFKGYVEDPRRFPLKSASADNEAEKKTGRSDEMMIFHMVLCVLKMFESFEMRIQGSSKRRHQSG